MIKEVMSATMGVDQAVIDGIISRHNEFMTSVKTSLHKALEIGEALILVKDQLEHGEFLTWIEDNLPFAERTAQKYMRVARKQDVLEEKGARMITEAYDSLSKPKKKDYYSEYSEREALLPDDLEDDEDDEPEFVPPVTAGAVEVDKRAYDYWAVTQKAIRALRWAYSRLAATRGAKTPRSLGYMIGNIDEMADRLQKWSPEELEECKECDGGGWLKAEDQYGNLTDVPCNWCIGGKAGPFKITDR